jgi:DICT domain-containing protein
MTLREFLDEVASHRRTITVFAPAPDETLERYFETRNVAVEHEPLPDDGSGGFVVVTADGEFVGSLARSAVREFVSPGEVDLGPNEGVRLPMNLLSDTTFVSFDRRKLLAATREIEDRAYRQGRGTLRSGFQTLSRFATERDRYESIAAESDLDVHAYGRPDRTTDRSISELESATVHVEGAEEIAAHWFVVFDGGGDGQQACALLAEEVASGPNSFRGFWTYDPELVGDIDAYLRETYDDA